MTAFIDGLGRRVIGALRGITDGIGYLGRLTVESVRFWRRGAPAIRVLVMQILFTGVEALPVISVLALAIGVSINLVGSSVLSDFGQGQLAYTLLIIVVTKELGPLLTAFVVTARSGTAMATELGGMAVSHELEAYVAVGADPVAALAAPRLIGVTLSVVFLTIYFNIFGLLGSFAVLQALSPIRLSEYLGELVAVLSLGDLLWGIVKSFVFGVIIAAVSTWKGFAVSRASTEIPVAGIRAVGTSFVLVILADALLTAVAYV